LALLITIACRHRREEAMQATCHIFKTKGFERIDRNQANSLIFIL
jgi:hypothetical protein